MHNICRQEANEPTTTWSDRTVSPHPGQRYWRPP